MRMDRNQKRSANKSSFAFAGIALACAALCSCGRRAESTPPTIVAASRAVPAPRRASVVIQDGSTLGEVAEEAYGHNRFAGFIAKINGLSDPERLKSGATIATPSLEKAFEKAHLDPQFQGAIHYLALSSTDYFALLPAYLEALHSSPRNKDVALSPDLRQKLNACADYLDTADAILSSARAPFSPPKLAIGQFSKTSELLRKLATGIMIDEYTRDTIAQRFGLGFTNLMIWTQNHQQ